MAYLLGVVGLSCSEYLELTPYEASEIIKAYKENKTDEFKTIEVLIYNAVGQVLGGKGKFKSAISESKKKVISLEEKKVIANRILKELGGGG
jgi:hypothetical protein